MKRDHALTHAVEPLGLGHGKIVFLPEVVRDVVVLEGFQLRALRRG